MPERKRSFFIDVFPKDPFGLKVFARCKYKFKSKTSLCNICIAVEKNVTIKTKIEIASCPKNGPNRLVVQLPFDN